jgi:nucleoside-diphosphate-sugar epimerase
LYIDNLIEAMFLAARQDQAAGEVFHISDAAPITWKDYIEAYAYLLGDDYLPLPEMSTQEIMAAIRAAAEVGMPALPRSSLKQAFRLIRDQRTREVLRTIPVVDRSAKAGKAIAQTLVPAPIRHQLRQKLLSHNDTNGSPNGLVEPAPRPLLSEDEVKMYTTFDKVVFPIDKARRLLGYDPKIDFTEGMKRTAAWIEWARL